MKPPELACVAPASVRKTKFPFELMEVSCWAPVVMVEFVVRVNWPAVPTEYGKTVCRPVDRVEAAGAGEPHHVGFGPTGK